MPDICFITLSINMKRDHFCVDCRVKSTRNTKRRLIPSEVTSALMTVEDGTSGNRVDREERFAEWDNRNVLNPQDNQDAAFEVDSKRLPHSLCEAESKQEKERSTLLSHHEPPPEGNYVLWRVDSSQNDNSDKFIKILTSIGSNYGHIDDIASPFEDPEILALQPNSSGSTSCDASMHECILSSE